MQKFFILYESKNDGSPIFVSTCENIPIHWEDKNDAVRACGKLFSAHSHPVVYIISFQPKPIIEAVKI